MINLYSFFSLRKYSSANRLRGLPHQTDNILCFGMLANAKPIRNSFLPIQSNYFYILACIFLFAACEPYIEDDIILADLPESPSILIEVDTENPNKIIIKDVSDGFFARTWELPGATPDKSTLAIDTVLYTKAGEYNISLHAAKEGGGGTSSATQTVVIEADAILDCSEEITFLTGGCDNLEGKCWTFSQISGAISVGPERGSNEWFSSTEGGLVPEQYDDSFCFTFERSAFLYQNNGQTIDPFNGYVAIDFAPPTDLTYFLEPNAGLNGETRIVLPEGAFIGVWDSGPVYEIIKLAENELVLRSQIVGNDGWFDLFFVPN